MFSVLADFMLIRKLWTVVEASSVCHGGIISTCI